MKKWQCLLGIHKWDGCICRLCGKTRDDGHDFRSDCEECSKCGEGRYKQHDWQGCKCSICGRLLPEWEYEYSLSRTHTWNGCKCSVCGKQRDENHIWNGCKCTQCGEWRDERHDWREDMYRCSVCGEKRDSIYYIHNEKITFERLDDYQTIAGQVERFARCGLAFLDSCLEVCLLDHENMYYLKVRGYAGEVEVELRTAEFDDGNARFEMQLVKYDLTCPTLYGRTGGYHFFKAREVAAGHFADFSENYNLDLKLSRIYCPIEYTGSGVEGSSGEVFTPETLKVPEKVLPVYCPHGHGPLYIPSFKCRRCKYVNEDGFASVLTSLNIVKVQGDWKSLHDAVAEVEGWAGQWAAVGKGITVYSESNGDCVDVIGETGFDGFGMHAEEEGREYTSSHIKVSRVSETEYVCEEDSQFHPYW